MKMDYRSAPVLFLIFLSSFAKCEAKVAEALLQAGTINGTVTFTETENGIHVTGIITGMPVGLYGFHVHEIGNVSTCDASGPHFDPEGNTHGGRDHPVRHIGDLGNVQFVAGGGAAAIAYINFLDNLIAFNGTNNIVGRTLVLHEQEDDLGLGGDENSLTTGNAGARVACAIIREVTSGVGSINPSLSVLVLTILFMFYTL